MELSSGSNEEDSLLKMFVVESYQNTQQLKEIILYTKKVGRFSQSSINKIFRIVHTIKGSAAMMQFSRIATLGHKIEDFLSCIRDNTAINYDLCLVSDLIFSCADYINREIDNIAKGTIIDENDNASLIKAIDQILFKLKQGESDNPEWMTSIKAMDEQGSIDQHIRLQSIETVPEELKCLNLDSSHIIPLSGTFHCMQRIVLDMSNMLGKGTQLKLIGEETKVNSNIINCITDSLIHLVRNCIDHGVESTQERILKNKPPIATVTIKAQNIDSSVLITVSDDGRGLHKDKILSRARAYNLLDMQLEMTDKEIYNLIFLPGFTTRETVSEYSGRGVGLDVVMQSICSIGGSVLLNNEPGKGLTVSLKIPLTMPY